MSEAKKIVPSFFQLKSDQGLKDLYLGLQTIDASNGLKNTLLSLNVGEDFVEIKALQGSFKIHGQVYQEFITKDSCYLEVEDQVFSLIFQKIEQSFVPNLQLKQKPVLIEDEYCYLHFEQDFSSLRVSPLSKIEPVADQYVDLESSEEIFPIIQDNPGQSLEIFVTEKDIILDIHYLNIHENKTWYIGPEEDKDTLLMDSLLVKSSFLQVSGGRVQLYPQKDLKVFSKKKNQEIIQQELYDVTTDDEIICTYKTQHVVLKISDQPPKILPLSPFARERAFLMQALLIFLPLALPFLILLLVDPSLFIKKEEVKKLAVIYTPPKEKVVKKEPEVLKTETPPEPKAKKKPEEVQKGVKDKTLKEEKNAANTKKQLAPAAQEKVGSVSKPKKQVAHEGMKSPKTESPKITKKAAIPKISMDEKRQSTRGSQPAPTTPQSAPPPAPAPAKTFGGVKSQGSFANLMGSSQKAYGGSVTAAQSNSLEGVKSGQVVVNSDNTGGSLRAGVGAVGGVGSDYSGAVSKAGYGAGGLAERGSLDTAKGGTRTVLKGSIDPELVDRLLNEAKSQFQYCYQQELVKNSQLRGVVKVSFIINPGASVSGVKVEGNQWSQAGRACISNVLRSINFPEPKGGGSAAFDKSFNFSSENQAF